MYRHIYQEKQPTHWNSAFVVGLPLTTSVHGDVDREQEPERFEAQRTKACAPSQMSPLRFECEEIGQDVQARWIPREQVHKVLQWRAASIRIFSKLWRLESGSASFSLQEADAVLSLRMHCRATLDGKFVFKGMANLQGLGHSDGSSRISRYVVSVHLPRSAPILPHFG